MIANLVIDPDSVVLLNIQSNTFDVGRHYARAFLHPVIDEDAMGRFDYKIFGQELYHLGKKSHKMLRNYRSTRKLLDVYRDVGFDKFYTKHVGHSKKLILKGYPGLRKTSKFTMKSFDKAVSGLGKFGVKAVKASRGKYFLIDAGFEITEWVVDNYAAKLEGRTLTIEEQIRHGGDVAATAVGGVATIGATAALLGLASTGVGIPVVLMLVIPAVVGSLATSGYKTALSRQIDRANQDMEQSSQNARKVNMPEVSDHYSSISCHVVDKVEIPNPTLQLPPEGIPIDQKHALLEWIRQTNESSSDVEFAKGIKATE